MVPADAALILALLLGLYLASILVLLSRLSYAWARRLGRMPPDRRFWVERRWVTLAASCILVLYAVAAAWGTLVERHWVAFTRHRVKVAEPVLGEPVFRIVHLSDLHLDQIGARERKAVDLVRESRPHLIVLTGDYLDTRGGGPALLEMLRALKAVGARHGIVAVGGSTDEKYRVRSLFRQEKIEWLEDDTQTVEREGRRLRLAGQAARPAKTVREILGGLGTEVFTILLRHSPDVAEELEVRGAEARVDLVLAGQTHGGQVCLPFWGAILTGARTHKRYERGLHRVGDVPMAVSRGLGTSGVPIRLLSRPEVTLIELAGPN